jgi:hypothetical protein
MYPWKSLTGQSARGEGSSGHLQSPLLGYLIAPKEEWQTHSWAHVAYGAGVRKWFNGRQERCGTLVTYIIKTVDRNT